MSREQWQIDQGDACGCKGQDEMCPCQNVNRAEIDPYKEAVRRLNEAAYAAIRSCKDTTRYPMINRHMLRQIAAMSDKLVDAGPDQTAEAS
jgi:uncharacterized Fe-S center protein